MPKELALHSFNDTKVFELLYLCSFVNKLKTQHAAVQYLRENKYHEDCIYNIYDLIQIKPFYLLSF